MDMKNEISSINKGENMTKETWFKHIDTLGIIRPSLGGTKEQYTADLKAHMATGCPECKARLATKKANYRARAKHQAYLDAGLVRVRGALGGTYYE
mgnify:CR=1 FL=1